MICVDVLTDKESADWLAELERAYPPSYYFTIVRVDDGKVYITQIDPNEWDNGREETSYTELHNAELLAIIEDKPYYEKIVASLLAGNINGC